LTRYAASAFLAFLAACGGSEDPANIYIPANRCFVVETGGVSLTHTADSVAFDSAEGTPYFFRPTGLGTYLLYDGQYVVGDSVNLGSAEQLLSDITEIEEGYVSAGEWALEAHPSKNSAYQLRNLATQQVLIKKGLASADNNGAAITLADATGCEQPPELTIDAEGQVERTHFDDGTLYGAVDMHSHMFTNLGFGGGLYHGAPFHPYGIEHALPACDIHHGEAGRLDFFGYAYDAGNDSASLDAVLPGLLSGELAEDNHNTDGYPNFTEWPNARKRATHQVQYYKWIERAWLAGLRLVVQHATTNSVICDITVGAGFSHGRFPCNDMAAVDRQIDAAYALQDYVDAQLGGPGMGWFRVVTTPAQAREVIAEGKMAVILGIETSNLFECLVTPRADSPVCDLDYVRSQLDEYHGRGVRALFPVHKYDNMFTPGDGDPDFIEIGNVINSGHYTNMTEDCPEDPMRADNGPVSFGGFLQPREDYLSEAPLDFSLLPEDPIVTLLPHVPAISSGKVDGDFCQNAGLTNLGEQLIHEMMMRGMIVEVDHLPQWSYVRAFEMLKEANYPAVGTHGFDHSGKLYDIGGLSFREFGRCHDPETPGASWRRYNDRLDAMVAAGLYPGLGVAFDLNGFASAPGPRFGPEGCGEDQQNPVTYPFTSMAGDVTFTEPKAGNRVFDYNTEGMVHLGLFPEYIENARIDMVNPGDMDPLFRSAEGYIRMWELAEERGASLAP